MTEQKAQAVAQALGGQAWQSGGDMWLTLIAQPHGGLIAISEEAICEYQSDSDFEAAQPRTTMLLDVGACALN